MPYILLDAECIEDAIQKAQELNPTYQSLYRTREGADEVSPDEAPYLFSWPHCDAFSNLILQEGWGQAWGIIMQSTADFKALYQHLRRFLTVQLEGGEQVRFRFYDPRVLRLFLPGCDTAQLREFFGPVEYFLMEDEDASLAIRFWLQDGQLQSAKFPLSDVSDGSIPLISVDKISAGDPTNKSDAAKPQQAESIPGDKKYHESIKSKWSMFD